jgi:hypothetical protein
MKTIEQTRWLVISTGCIFLLSSPINAQCSKTNPSGVGKMPSQNQFAKQGLGGSFPPGMQSQRSAQPLTQQQMLQQQLVYQTMLQQQMLQQQMLQQQTVYQMMLQQRSQYLLNGLQQPLMSPEQMVLQMGLADEQTLKQGLQNPQAGIRWASAWVAGNQMKPFQEELIGLLQDPNTLVRDAAHRGLIILANKDLVADSIKKKKAVPANELRDFGPQPNANADQINSASNQWREFFTTKKEEAHAKQGF